MCVQAPLIIFLQIKIKQSTSALESHRPLLLFTYQHVAPSHRLTAVPGSGASPQLSLCVGANAPQSSFSPEARRSSLCVAFCCHLHQAQSLSPGLSVFPLSCVATSVQCGPINPYYFSCKSGVIIISIKIRC